MFAAVLRATCMPTPAAIPGPVSQWWRFRIRLPPMSTFLASTCMSSHPHCHSSCWQYCGSANSTMHSRCWTLYAASTNPFDALNSPVTCPCTSACWGPKSTGNWSGEWTMPSCNIMLEIDWSGSNSWCWLGWASWPWLRSLAYCHTYRLDMRVPNLGKWGATWCGLCWVCWQGLWLLASPHGCTGLATSWASTDVWFLY